MKSIAQRLALAATLSVTCRAAMASDQFGAISYSRSHGVYAIELNLATRDGAERAARVACGRVGRDCSTPVWVMNGCVSIAIGRAHGFGSGWGSTRASSEEEAMAVCRANAPSCAIRKTDCTLSY